MPRMWNPAKVYAAGLVIRDLPLLVSNFRSHDPCPTTCKRNNVVAIADIDTRKLTRILREKGAQNGCIMAGEADEVRRAGTWRAASPVWRGWTWRRWCQCSSPTSGRRRVGAGQGLSRRPRSREFHVVAFDFGVKRNILRMLAERGCRVTVVPAQTTAEQVLALNPDGVFLSNGPGDPEPCDYAIAAIRD